ncbi:MAG TPA: sugar phosphate isomerase/epimerase [Tepidisphaeraceae bacterium]|jgi:sugar phosphate isomerase/epimerase|nr:sugar phosphate isomerase/epimerase [Tepidisphaeraceae bacterium]
MSKIAAQLYTLRDYTRTPADIAKTFRKVRELGFEAVQCSALGKIEPAELARILRDEGLVCCATHASLDRLENEPAKVIEEHRMWDCHFTALGHFGVKDASRQTWLDFSDRFNRIAAGFDGSGLAVGYHNHSHELARFDGQTALGLLIEKLNKKVWLEIDTFWITHGGGDPAAWIDSVSGRIPCVHLKDMQIGPDDKQRMAEVGQGNLNWQRIFPACRSAGVQWYIIEQDTCYRDPFESLKISLDYVKGMGVK